MRTKLQRAGYLPVSKIRLNKFTKCPLMASFPIFMTSFNILSKPGDLFAFSLLIAASNSSSVIGYYKITKIVRALWLAERSVCMRVCKHGCGVKSFCFSSANHASTNLKTFSSSKLEKFTLFTHSFVGWNLENRYKQGVSICSRVSRHFKREKCVFWKASFCKTRTDYECKTTCTRLCGW